MSKQTTVQWLHYHLLHLMQTKEWRSKDLHIAKFDQLFVEALAMEREQIEQAFNEEKIVWVTKIDDDGRMSLSNEIAYPNSKAYYNETYKGGEQ